MPPRPRASPASSKRTAAAVPELPAMQTLDAAGIAALEPALGTRFAQGLYLPGEGQLDNRAAAGGAAAPRCKRCRASTALAQPARPRRLRPGQRGQPDWVFDCRGLGARPPVAGPARRARRNHPRACARRHAASRPTRLVHPRYPLYIAPKQDHLFVIGATEIESDDMSPASVRSTLELLSAAYSVHSGFAEARIVEIATQCRPTLPDNLPAIRQPGPARAADQRPVPPRLHDCARRCSTWRWNCSPPAQSPLASTLRAGLEPAEGVRFMNILINDNAHELPAAARRWPTRSPLLQRHAAVRRGRQHAVRAAHALRAARCCSPTTTSK